MVAVGLLRVSPKQTLHFGVRTKAVGDGRTPKVITSEAEEKGAVALLGLGGVSLVRSTICFFLRAGSALATIEIICKSSTPPVWPSSNHGIGGTPGNLIGCAELKAYLPHK